LEKELQERRMERESLLQQQVAFQTASAIAHELNQPLFAIAANSEAALRMLKAGNPQPDKLMSALEANVRQAQRAAQSTRQLLEFANKSEVAAEALDLNHEVGTALHSVKADFEMVFKSELELEKDLPLVWANRGHVQKVLVNLLRNGVEAMAEAGVPAPAITVTVRTAREENFAQVSVCDNGPGLKPEDIKRVFQPFYTTKTNGIGMGLKISRSLIEANGGQLWVDAEEGRGAAFHFTLPFAR
jgi:C4-dicarboxylate-specific signal transduction histidine kinase